ncbi:MAG: pyridoxal 5'-phosphate synthase glutaminase subunit PdxT [Candidatus Magasanikbacteria bacterium CG10_big_fil_rev_8_21_14_0_10_40_10]|uniref:Pyridoxal 5'-phosphate synthase glutaminase subunit PdxT n=1 Tax=Candidatus Magasanikbacteria bacterium CG10_big_fil_rev_8_21_14_0_10_40_10 TaxID=1974648 RepID=A0A2M6W3Q9_9BACT|nr:MAG: pyridoxal 5'-phosphate synthase glutaminase subunit PdxT [Candidatus Magasanikbacteria bacterium CG10_big_fil_rev_8_21_14_0_10_40_10]
MPKNRSQNKIGILAIQGSFAEHARILRRLRAPFELIRAPQALQQTTHLIIPGGESTTLVSLLKKFALWPILQKKSQDGSLKIFGTCAGAIICSRLGMNIQIQRNGYGAQQDSFVDKLDSELFPGLTGVFIRAPKIINAGIDVQILATHQKNPVLARQNNFLASCFHPELTGETRLHQYFLKI